MNVLICGDAVASSGFARCTHALADYLHSQGHKVAILGINYYGDPHSYPYEIWPCRNPHDGGNDGFGVYRLPLLVDRMNPDVVVLLNDPWNIPAYLQALKSYEVDAVPVVGWLAVDAKNQQGAALNKLTRVVCWTQFGLDELRAGGYTRPGAVIPLSVDTNHYSPSDKAQARARTFGDLPIKLPEDAYIVGVLGRNQPRKRLDLALRYFREWVLADRAANAYLYLHIGPTGDRGCDFRKLIAYYGIGDGHVLLREPPIGSGVEEAGMPHIYNSMDVVLTTTQGEGWGLTTHEAMACGVPCVVPDWAALGSEGGWPGPAVLRVPCTSTALNAPLDGRPYTIGGIADEKATIWALRNLYASAEMRATYGEAARQTVLQDRFSPLVVGRAFEKELQLAIEDKELELAAVFSAEEVPSVVGD